MASDADRSEIKELLFRSGEALEELARVLGLSDPEHDHENYWEWVIGDLRGARIDITRTHTMPANETDTRLFRLDGGTIDEDLKRHLIARLAPYVTGAIRCGWSRPGLGNAFEWVTVEEFPGPQ